MIEPLRTVACTMALIIAILFCIFLFIVLLFLFYLMIKQAIECINVKRELKREQLLHEFENARIQAEIDLHRMETQGELYHG